MQFHIVLVQEYCFHYNQNVHHNNCHILHQLLHHNYYLLHHNIHMHQDIYTLHILNLFHHIIQDGL